MSYQYESHLTFKHSDRETVKAVSKHYPDWHFSEIDGDPNLGDGVKCYLTAHSNKYHELMVDMTAIDAYAMSKGATAIRMKIEEILYDARR